MCSGYRAPCIVIFEAAPSIFRRSSVVRSTAAAPMFSSRRCNWSCPGLERSVPFALAIKPKRFEQTSLFVPVRSSATDRPTLIRLAVFQVKRGTASRKSVPSNVVVSSILPVRKPFPSGLNGIEGLAERGGFEPPIPVKVCPLSRRIVSTAHAPLRVENFVSG